MIRIGHVVITSKSQNFNLLKLKDNFSFPRSPLWIPWSSSVSSFWAMTQSSRLLPSFNSIGTDGFQLLWQHKYPRRIWGVLPASDHFISLQTHFCWPQWFLGPCLKARGMASIAFCLPMKEKRAGNGDHWPSVLSWFSSACREHQRPYWQWLRQWKKQTVSLDDFPEGNTSYLVCWNKNLSQYFISTLWVYKIKHWPTSLGKHYPKALDHGLKLLCQAKPFSKHPLLWLFWIKTVYNIREKAYKNQLFSERENLPTFSFQFFVVFKHSFKWDNIWLIEWALPKPSKCPDSMAHRREVKSPLPAQSGAFEIN